MFHSCLSCTFHIQFNFVGERQRRSIKITKSKYKSTKYNMSPKTFFFLFEVMAYEHKSTQVALAREHISTQDTLAREHISTQD